MKEAGYDTHLYGKWHLGYCDERFRPNNRGFDTSYGLGYHGEILTFLKFENFLGKFFEPRNKVCD